MKIFFLYVMVLLYLLGGINHFANTQWYLNIMPPYLPYQTAAVYITGACEIIFGLLLLPRRTRRVAAILIIILLIVIFPANIQMAINYHRERNPLLWIAIVRLPLQLVLIRWSWHYTRRKNLHRRHPEKPLVFLLIL